MDIKLRGQGSFTRLNIAEMIQMYNEYKEEVDGRPKYSIKELCKKYKNISAETFHRYIRYLKTNV